MGKNCEISGVKFEISEADLFFYKLLGVPAPKLCPLERQRRRIAFRNFRSLYYRYCSVKGQRILSMYPQQAPFPVYGSEAWWSDTWDARTFGRDFDFKRPFFQQYQFLSNIRIWLR